MVHFIPIRTDDAELELVADHDTSSVRFMSRSVKEIRPSLVYEQHMWCQ